MEDLPSVATGTKSRLILLLSKTNFETIDFFIYLPGNKLKVILPEYGVSTLKIEIKTGENILFACQAKKDFCFASSISGDWQKSKIKIQELMNRINLFFILVNDYRSGDTGKKVSSFEKFDPENLENKLKKEKEEEEKKNEKEKIEKRKEETKDQKNGQDMFVLFTDTLNRNYFYEK